MGHSGTGADVEAADGISVKCRGTVPAGDCLLRDEATAKDRRLGEGVDAPALPTVKDFLRFYVATSRPADYC
jgi:hypothetical protein